MAKTSVFVNTPAGYSLEITELLRSNLTPRRLQEKLASYHENDIAAALELLTPAERAKLYQILDGETLADVLEYSDHMADYVRELSVRKKVDVFSRMEPADIVEVLRQLDKEERETLVDLLEPAVRSDVKLLSSFEEEEIGSIMSTNYIAVSDHTTVKQAMSELVRQAAENDNISTIYVVDGNETFYGAIDLKDLIIARESDELEDIISTSYPYVTEHEKIENCIETIKDYAEDSLPVLTDNGKLIGILTAQDIVEAVDDEMGEDYAKLAGLTAEEDLHEKTSTSIKKRLPWLIILLFLGMAVSSVVGVFETVVAVLPIVMCFQSLILDMAGNVGTQSLAVTIRVLVDETLTAKQKFGLVLKEMKVGFLNGLFLGILSFVFIGLYISVLKNYPMGHAFLISGCVGFSLMVAMVISSMVGTLIPMFFHKIKIDPAVASGPLITTVNDLVAVVTYYGLAWLLLIHVLNMI